MADKSDEQALISTLKLAGIANPKLDKIRTLEFSRANKKENKRVHDATNRLILDLLESEDLGTCIHVTGEMRALADPFHRQVCEEMRRRDKGSFHVLYHLPTDRHQNAAALVQWNLSRWAAGRTRRWDEELRTIDVIGNRSVDLLAYDTLQEIQYSVFGKKYVLLQEKHPDTSVSKRVWLLESDDINGHLSERARTFIDNAVNIDEGMFREFAVNLSGVAARRCLSKLEKGALEKDRVLSDPLVSDFARDPQGSVDALKVMEFVKEDRAGRLHITPSGRKFLNSY